MSLEAPNTTLICKLVRRTSATLSVGDVANKEGKKKSSFVQLNSWWPAQQIHCLCHQWKQQMMGERRVKMRNCWKVKSCSHALRFPIIKWSLADAQCKWTNQVSVNGMLCTHEAHQQPTVFPQLSRSLRATTASERQRHEKRGNLTSLLLCVLVLLFHTLFNLNSYSHLAVILVSVLSRTENIDCM